MKTIACSHWPLATLTILLFCVPAGAAEPASLNLISPNSLAGWDQGEPVHGWRAQGTTLVGSADSSPLLAGWTFGDFSLAFHWNVAPGAALLISLPEVAAPPPPANRTGPGREAPKVRTVRGREAPKVRADDEVQMRFVEVGKIGSLTAHALAVNTPVTQSLPASTMHTTRIERTGDRLIVRVDDRPLGEVHVSAKARFGLQLVADGGEVEVADVTMHEPAGEPIFNGQDLTGWWSPNGLKSWQAHDDMIECLHKDGNYLRTEKSYGNFTLSFDYLASRGCNSGVGIRTARNGWPSGDGFELQLYDAPGLVKDSTMAIYGNLEPLVRADRSQEWNSAVIKADGPMISAWVNGQLVQHANTARHPELKHRHSEGWIGLQDHGGKIEFRNLRVLAAPDGNGLEAWYEPRDASGPELVCNRLLNPVQLSVADGITAGVATSSIGGSAEQVLADLTGPGAVTQFWRSKPVGTLALYFDGQSQPAIECDADELALEIPVLFEQKEPILTCLPYAKSLKIAIREADRTDYRIEYVNFPAGVPVETFTPGHPVLPRGWLAALQYRGDQYGWGTHREAGLEPRVSGEAKSLEPGQIETLVTTPGRGIVQWLKLQTDVAVLANDNLWLEVSIDGETVPAIAAPARYFFPSLIGGTNHDNFLAVYGERSTSEGFTSMLAMPFGDGITVRARNAGDTTLGRVGATVSLIEDNLGPWKEEKLQINDSLRLRGQFHKANDSSQWLERNGSGRWVGLVCDSPAGSSPKFATVTVDGQELRAWGGASLDAVLGIVGDEKEFFHIQGGRSHGLAWRYWQLAPIGFQKSIVVSASGPVPDHLALFYVH